MCTVLIFNIFIVIQFTCASCDILYITTRAGAVEYTYCRGVRLSPNECPGYDTKKSDGEASVMLEI